MVVPDGQIVVKYCKCPSTTTMHPDHLPHLPHFVKA